MNVLEVKDLGINFGGLRAVDHFNLTIKKGELYGLIGPNGAGKTTVFNMLTGVYAPSDGQIMLQGQVLNNLSCHKIAQLGVARTFQNIRLFKDLSVIDNVKIGLHEQYKYSLLHSLLKTKKFFDIEKQIEKEAMDLLEVFRLHTYAHVLAANLPYGKQRELEIARALATHPKLLLLDEPAAGMNPQETAELMEVIRKVRKRFDISILLIEHDMKLVMGICEKVTVLNYGSVLVSGTPQEVINDPRVIKAYLGD
ncbi:MAG: ABC transporter ATP-binding protein [Erysipelotrichaceae bacterium]|nr:ABC transporter ATP-binding protein [Erysipelotrichaceae bacterium]MDY5251530.1 ABC transporter ATP-binding protein [Erysipelotrichaceae bacterium]